MVEQLARVEVDVRGDLGIARIIGEVDLSNAAVIAKEVEAAVANRAARHVLDLTQTTHFDSAGIRMLFSLATLLRERREELIIVVPASGIVRRILDLTDVAEVCAVYPSFEAIPPS